jgi:hypothetical protein
MSDQAVVQISSPIRQGDFPQVVVRVDSLGEVEEAVDILNEVAERVAPLIKSTAMAMVSVPGGTAQAISHLQQGGMNPQVVQDSIHTQPAPVAITQCPACSKSTACSECQSPTQHTIKHSNAKNQDYNVHQCLANDRHKVTWCKTPISGALRTVVVGNNLVYGN